jgi:hypothetical protein
MYCSSCRALHAGPQLDNVGFLPEGVKFHLLNKKVLCFYFIKFTPSLVAPYFPCAVCQPKMTDKAWTHGVGKANCIVGF